jgi:DNA-binding transcriptional LysR family regulator
MTVTPLAPPSRRRSPESLIDVSPRLLRCFVTLGEELHFGRAADRLFVAQPALSRSIKQLERLLGRQLFVRTTRTVALTPSAAILLPAAREVLASLGALSEDLAAAHDTLRVAHLPFTDTVAVLLDAFAQGAPATPVRETTLGPSDQLAALRDGRLDVAFCRGPLGEDPALRTQVVRLDPLMVGVIGRDPALDRPVDLRRRTVAVAHDPAAADDFGAFVGAYEAAAGVTIRRVPVATGSGTEAYAMRRAGAHAYVTLRSRGVRLDAPCPLVGALPLQAYYAWTLVWRRSAPAPVRRFVEVATEVAALRGWLDTTALPGEPWIPEADAGWTALAA